MSILAFSACSSDSKNTAIDAATPQSDAPAGAAPDCTTYCTAIQDHCTGTNAQYPTMDQCMGTCAAFPVGKLADTTGNTLGCRLYHAGAPAMSAPTTHCYHAGPGGASADGVTSQCGADCDGFCSIVMKTCAGKYADLATCQAACGGFTSTPPFNDMATGNTRQCRLYHATNAAAVGQMSVAAHCGHATNTANAPPCMTP